MTLAQPFEAGSVYIVSSREATNEVGFRSIATRRTWFARRIHPALKGRAKFIATLSVAHFKLETRSKAHFLEVKMSEEREDNTIYKVVMNHEEQYSIWPADRENALGWNDAGKTGTKEECLAYIKEVWTDMRPLSLRKKMEGKIADAEMLRMSHSRRRFSAAITMGTPRKETV